MSAHAVPAAPLRPALTFRGKSFPVLLPKLTDPRLHLALTLTSLQVIGQLGFHFELSIAQILLAVGTAAVLEVGIALVAQRVILWPASALLTGNGVAFVLRVPGTAHGDWWSLRGWWIYVGTAAISILSKYVVKWRGTHVFNPSNIGLVICFLALGRNRAAPLDFWWGPMSVWLGLALGVIVVAGFAILWRLKLLRVALAFWISFAAAIGVLALAGHTMTARWHLGPIWGFSLWWVLITSPEVLVFLFFMITDPKTAPRSPRARLVYGISLGLLAAILIAPTTSEFAAKVALLLSLAVVCVAMQLRHPVTRLLERQWRLSFLAPAVVAAGLAAVVVANATPLPTGPIPLPPGALPPIKIVPVPGPAHLDLHTARLIAHWYLKAKPSTSRVALRMWLVVVNGQGPLRAEVERFGITCGLDPTPSERRWKLNRSTCTHPPASRGHG
jgi:Na+-translocating ferredoxin:NAD+ oxidoreductase RnfD subunit